MIEEGLSSYVVNTEFSQLPASVVEKAKLGILDWIGVTLAGSLEPSTGILLDFIRETCDKRQATVIGKSELVSVTNAALANGFMSHILDLDDGIFLAALHTTIPTLPVALAVSEWKRLNGKELITAYVLGVEVETRISYAVGGKEVGSPYLKGWHNTSVLGVFGAAAVAGKLLGLNEKKMRMALGVAGVQAAGLREAFGTMCKPFQVGKAASNGISAALLAQKGFTSSERILEGGGFSSEGVGLGRIISDTFDPDIGTRNLGKEFAILRINFKRYPSCGMTHAPIDATMRIVKEFDLMPDNIEEVEVQTTSSAMIAANILEPKTGMEGRFSISFCVAIAIQDREVGMASFDDSKVRDPRVMNLMKRIKVKINPEWVGIVIPGSEAKVIVKTKDGKVHTAKIEDTTQAMRTFDQVAAKFDILARMLFSDDRIKEIKETVKSAEKMDMMDLASLLRPVD